MNAVSRMGRLAEMVEDELRFYEEDPKRALPKDVASLIIHIRYLQAKVEVKDVVIKDLREKLKVSEEKLVVSNGMVEDISENCRVYVGELEATAKELEEMKRKQIPPWTETD